MSIHPAYLIFWAMMVLLAIWSAWPAWSNSKLRMRARVPRPGQPGAPPETDLIWIDLDGPLLNPDWTMEEVRGEFTNCMRSGRFDGGVLRASKNTLIVVGWSLGRTHIVFGEDGRIKRVEEREEIPSEKKKGFYISGKVTKTLYPREGPVIRIRNEVEIKQIRRNLDKAARLPSKLGIRLMPERPLLTVIAAFILLGFGVIVAFVYWLAATGVIKIG